MKRIVYLVILLLSVSGCGFIGDRVIARATEEFQIGGQAIEAETWAAENGFGAPRECDALERRAGWPDKCPFYFLKNQEQARQNKKRLRREFG